VFVGNKYSALSETCLSYIAGIIKHAKRCNFQGTLVRALLFHINLDGIYATRTTMISTAAAAVMPKIMVINWRRWRRGP